MTLPVLAGVFLFLLFLRVPIAFCIGLASLAAMLVSLPAEPAAMTIAQRVGMSVTSFPLLAIPFFILAGKLLATGGVARRVVDFARVTLGFLPGGLALTNVVANMVFGAVSGSAAAAASGIGGFMIPAMEKEGYPRAYATALTITAATTGLLIPPSNVFIVYAMVAGGVSIAALFVAGYLPGLILGLSLVAVAMVMAGTQGLGTRTPRPSAGELARAILRVSPTLLLLVLVMGGIVTGVFTATEASAVAVFYALGLTRAYREMGWRDLPGVLRDTAATTGMVFLLIGTSMAMAWIFAYADVPQLIDVFIRGVSENPLVIILLINLILLAVGTFMDMTPAVLIFTPIFLPVMLDLAPALGLSRDLMRYQFGVIIVFNLCIGLCTPPVGTVLFIGCGLAKLTISQIIRPLLPFFAAMVAALLLVSYVPQASLWLPRDVFGL
ncbi:MAG TPA: TRAP transporter large permease subunit, partial [Vicinamibacteria bacterium]|nr:TRAP transporter large permease subunit [Vicinamibacteria bacterium]